MISTGKKTSEVLTSYLMDEREIGAQLTPGIHGITSKFIEHSWFFPEKIVFTIKLSHDFKIIFFTFKKRGLHA